MTMEATGRAETGARAAAEARATPVAAGAQATPEARTTPVAAGARTTPTVASAAAHRRRGAALESALLEAAWTLLRTTDYASFTIDAVARAAGTSRPVIYRRWPNRAQLALAALRAHVTSIAGTVPDSGDPREDILSVLRAISGRYDEFGPEAMNGILSETDDLPGETTSLIPRVLGQILERAVARGQLGPGPVPAHLLELPIELVRYDMIVAHRKPDEARLAQIVDEIFLPLVRARSS